MRIEGLPENVTGDLLLMHHRDENNQPFMTTATFTLQVTDGPARIFTVKAVCSKQDQFVKATGRMLVARRLIATLHDNAYLLPEFREGLSLKQVKQAIFAAICPPKKKS